MIEAVGTQESMWQEDRRSSNPRVIYLRGVVQPPRRDTGNHPVIASTVDHMAARSREAEPGRIGALEGWATTDLDAAAAEQEVLKAIWRELEQRVHDSQRAPTR